MRDTLKLAILQQVKASTLEEINLGTTTDPQTLKIAKELDPKECSALVSLLTTYKELFVWSYNEMKGLDPITPWPDSPLTQDVLTDHFTKGVGTVRIPDSERLQPVGIWFTTHIIHA